MPIDTHFPVDSYDDLVDRNSGDTMTTDRAAPAAMFEPPECDDVTAVGDWGLFLRRCGYVNANRGIDPSASLALKRRFCMAYLGGRAQLQGGVYMRARPSVFTPAFVDGMAAENCKRRYQRYPWLEKLISLQQQLDQNQYRTPPQESEQTNLMRRHLHVVPTTNGRN